MSLEDEAISELRASAHPVRLRMMSLLTGAPMSAAELARELNITQANASYHLRTLAKAGQVEATATESVRGGQAKKYRYRYSERTARSTDAARPVKSADPDEWRLYIEVLHQELVRRSAQRVGGQALSADAEVWLAPETWQKAMQLVKEASRLVHEEALRPHATGTVHVNFQAELFQLRDERDDPDSAR